MIPLASDTCRPRRGSRLTTVLVALAVLGACAGEDAPLVDPAAADREPDAIAVSVAPATRESMAALYSTSATLRAEKRATVTSRTRGVLEQLFVEEGDPVSAGQAIAQLENSEQLLAVDRYEMIHGIKSRELERSRTLNEEDLISDAEFEVIRQQVEELEHDLALARLTLERTTIAAPFDGIAVQRYLDLGATVNDGTPIFDLADLDPLYVDVSVPERHVARLAPGQVVQLSADSIELPVEARIERIAPVVDATTGTVKVTVAVDSTVALRPGAFVQIDVVTDVHEDALVVPRSALVAEGRRWHVYRVAPSGDTAEALEVELGFEQGQRVEIAGVVGDADLSPGDRVVVRGASALSDGARIHIVDAGGPAETKGGEGSEAAAAGGAAVGGTG